MAGDRPERFAHDIFSIERTFFKNLQVVVLQLLAHVA